MLNFLPAVTRAKALALRDSPDELAKFLRCAELHPELHAQAAQALGLDAPQAGRAAAQPRPPRSSPRAHP